MTISRLVFVMGPTNAGKSTLLDAARNLPDFGLIEVGKMMRAKYPPEHFKGQANPKHTAVEAWQMFTDSLAAHTAAGKEYVLVDGQPRDDEQCAAALALPNPKMFLNLWAPVAIREARARARDTDPEKLALSLARLHGDLPKLYDLISLLNARSVVVSADTSASDYSPQMVLDHIRLPECVWALGFTPTYTTVK